MPVDILERTIRAVDPALLHGRGDPWLYFYEDFLSIYDPKLRNNYGVYYTPVEVIGVQVRLVSQVLERKFSKSLSYADDGVVFLDPAAGTAAYPLAAIEHALSIVGQRFGEGMIAAKATDCAQNFYAFEILVGPYAVAHLRLTKLIIDEGGSLPEEGIRVFLTDTLESPHADPPKPPLFAKILTEEHRRAQQVKNRTRVLVCMGNPPYDREQDDAGDIPSGQRKGGWVRHRDPSTPNAEPLLEDFVRPALEAGAGVHLKNLYNDYVYFWRWALWKLFENPIASGPGIVSFITASSYLRGPGFIGMRQKMRGVFDELYILDLEGDQYGARKTENVFAIKTPVAIAIGIRYRGPNPTVPAKVHYTKLTGTRQEKLVKLKSSRGLEDVQWQTCFDAWLRPFLPEGEGDFFDWPLVTDLFPWQHSGVQFKRKWPIGETAHLLSSRWNSLLRKAGEERRALFRETRDRKYDRQYTLLGNSTKRAESIASLPPDTPSVPPTRYAYRSFDRQWVLPDSRIGDFLRPALWLVDSTRQIYLTSLFTKVLGLGPAATVTGAIPDLVIFAAEAART